MRKNNKKFIRNIIIISVCGLIALMILLFVILQSYLGKQPNTTYIEAQIESKEVDESISLSESKMILVDEIKENQLAGYDIKDDMLFSKKISDTVKVSDAYGKIFPITEVKKGDLVEVAYETDENYVISISKSIRVQSWKKISGITVDRTTHQVNIGGSNYTYSEETLVLNADGTGMNIENIGPFDVVSIQGMDQDIWSITVEETAANINMTNLPTQNGQIEIDNSRLIQFKDINEPIKVIPGSHKIVIKMDGYVTIVKTISLSSGEVYELSLEDSEIAYTLLKPYVGSAVEQYTVKIGGSSYSHTDEIRLPQGEYQVEILAEGYEKWVRKVKLEKDVYTLGVRLISIEEEEEEPETEEGIISEKNRTIVLNTEPSGAKVYIDGALKGETPYTISLLNGSYNILFEKNGYSIYNTNILLDGSNDQSHFLYVLSLSE